MLVVSNTSPLSSLAIIGRLDLLRDLGELLFAKQAGRIPSVREEVEKLQNEARFFIRADLKALILTEAGEQ